MHVVIKTIYARNVFNQSYELQLAMTTDLMQLTKKVTKCIFKVFSCSFKRLKNNSLCLLKFKCDYLSKELLRCTIQPISIFPVSFDHILSSSTIFF